MILPDINLLIYAHNIRAPHHQKALEWWNHFQTWSSLLKRLGTAGNLTTDAHLAALAIERGLILQTTDADFARFSGLKWNNPVN